MEKGKWKWCDKECKLIPCTEEKKRQQSPFVHIDEMAPIESMVNGKIYDSKSALRAHYKAAGVIEKGNDKAPGPNLRERSDEYDRKLQEDAERLYYEIRDNNCPEMTELDRERCKIMDHNLEHYNYDRRDIDEHGNYRE